jgi:hypothetical protein
MKGEERGIAGYFHVNLGLYPRRLLGSKDFLLEVILSFSAAESTTCLTA